MKGPALISVLGFLLSNPSLNAQDVEDNKKWDNQLFVGNKIAMAKGNWRYSGELQMRLKDNAQSLDRWFFEYAATYMHSKHREIVPDYRFSIKHENVEHPPGFGVLRKDLYGSENDPRHQLAH